MTDTEETEMSQADRQSMKIYQAVLQSYSVVCIMGMNLP